jgi:A/G-specific adenine glycosylase
VSDPLAVEQAAEKRNGLASRSSRSPKPDPKSIPNASCSRSNHPAPSPRIARPPETWSSVVAIFAVSPGFRNVLAPTMRPRRTRLVIAASAARVVHPSSFGAAGSPSSLSRWSSIHTWSKPAASAWSTAARSSGQVVCWTQNAAPNPIATGHLLAAYRRDVVRPSVAPPALPPAARDAILAWYDAAGRELPFRGVTDPYAILVSEAMAQQTQVTRAAAHWEAWMARFPTVEALAAAPLAEVLRAWAGLGYNRRAVHLHRTAKAIVEDYGGRVPDTVEELAALPGIGPYTARAVAAIAFGRSVGAVDVNVRRVLARIATGDADGLAPVALQALADGAVPADRPADWTHAVMDVGARFCRPAPRCADCPASAWCRYAAGERPVARRLAAAASPPRPFPATTRWLRGRILAKARVAADGDWLRYEEAIGTHEPAAVREALATLAGDGLLEVRERDGRPEARLPRG